VLKSKTKFYIYLPEFFIIIPLLIFFIYRILGPPDEHLVAFFILIASSAVYIFSFRRRSKELNQVKDIINKIGRNEYSSPDDFRLEKSMTSLEDEIKKMFLKNKGDIDYLRKLEKMRTEFIANVSHELRTPIFTIQGFVETLLDGAVNDKEVSRKFLQKAQQNTVNLGNLVNDLIDISMLETGEMRMSFRYFNINDFIRSVIPEISSMAEEKNLELIFHPGRENLQLLGDRTKLKQVLLNLLTNAIKYTDSGKIEVFITELDKKARISVKDTGIGISVPDQERIFERLYRVDKARSRSIGGTGLGLAIVKHIIEAHGSVIEVKSVVNEGSEFFFTLKK
jgi:two-component system, OmpR family, phosphate regulon sensor histidine kinase PhoR